MIHKTFDVDGPPDIEVRIESGRVELRRGSPGRVNVSVDTKSPDFVVEQRGNSILVSSDKTTPWLSRGSAYVVIEAPEGTDLQVAVASAQVHADIPLGKVDVKSASGDVEIDTAENLAVKTASGDLSVNRVSQALTFTSASGDLRVRDRVSGSLVVSTASGDIHVNESDATVTINSASGDADLKQFSGRSASFKTMSGTVEVGIPRRTEVSLDVNLLSGKLRLPDPEPTEEAPERQMSIKAKMVSGDLRIDRV